MRRVLREQRSRGEVEQVPGAASILLLPENEGLWHKERNESLEAYKLC